MCDEKNAVESSSASGGYMPGPWSQCGARDGKCSCGQIWSIPADCVVATVAQYRDGNDGPTPEAATANARLIAAAPDLLAACEEAVSVLPEGLAAATVAAAILRAKGM